MELRIVEAVTLASPGLFKHRHLFLVEIHIQLGIEGYRLRLPVLDVDPLNLARVQIKDVFRIRRKLGATLGARSGSKLLGHAWLGAVGLFQRIEVEICLSSY